MLLENYTHNQANMKLEEQVDSSGSKSLYMCGIFIQGEKKNQNGRIYPAHEIRNAVNQLNDKLKNGQPILGEADHPQGFNINIATVSHMITEISMNGNDGCGKLKILPTPSGNIVKTLLDNKVLLGVSSRGNGNIIERNDHELISDYQIVTIDIVVNPSAPDAFPRPIYEAWNFKNRGSIIEDLSRSLTFDPKAKKHLEKELINWIKSI